jgi:hypothetical protein
LRRRLRAAVGRAYSPLVERRSLNVALAHAYDDGLTALLQRDIGEYVKLPRVASFTIGSNINERLQRWPARRGP